MNTQFDIEKLIKQGEIKSELELERALIAERKLRVLSKEDPKFKITRSKLRNLIEEYEKVFWSPESKISERKLRESDIAEVIAEKERIFIANRRNLIRSKIKRLNLNQQDFGKILGHTNKSYISELINGIRPFSLKDLVIINRVLKIDLKDLIPTFLPLDERKKITASIKKLDNPKLKLSEDDFALV